MKTLAPWPREIPRVFKPLANIDLRHVEPYRLADLYAVGEARRRRREQHRQGGLTQTYSELFSANSQDYTAFNTSSSEGSLLAGVNRQPAIPALFLSSTQAFGKAFRFEASGVLGTTSTPTITFQCRLGTTLGSSFLSGTSVGVSAAITTQSGVSNKWWYLCLDLTCYVPGLGSTNCTLSGAGYVLSPAGFASPFAYPLEPTTPDTATWTSTIDGSVTQYFNLSATWSASSASNTITCKNLRAFCLN
jgi:hypothetical protein